MTGIESAPSNDDIAYLDERLEEFNTQQTGRNDFQPVQLVIRDDAGAVIAGLKAMTGWDWLYVEILWVHELHRKSGLGTQLMESAEATARERGCIGACLTSYCFQAPEFYQRLGYSAFGQIGDYPVGKTMHFMSKRFETTDIQP